MWHVDGEKCNYSNTVVIAIIMHATVINNAIIFMLPLLYVNQNVWIHTCINYYIKWYKNKLIATKLNFSVW